jgi:hypothetical protein
MKRQTLRQTLLWSDYLYGLLLVESSSMYESKVLQSVFFFYRHQVNFVAPAITAGMFHELNVSIGVVTGQEVS